MGNLVDKIEEIIGNIDLTIKVKEIVGDVVFVCDTTKHLAPNKIVTDENLKQYRVTALDFNVSVTLEPFGQPDPFAGSCIIGPTPQFVHGTPIAANLEYLSLGSYTLDKTPLIWLYEKTTSEIPYADSPLEAIFDARLYFMDFYGREWTNDDHNDYGVKPMQNLADMFEEVINKDFSFRRLTRTSDTPRSRFGVYLTNKGDVKKIIEEDLSGTERRLNIEAYNLDICKC